MYAGVVRVAGNGQDCGDNAMQHGMQSSVIKQVSEHFRELTEESIALDRPVEQK